MVRTKPFFSTLFFKKMANIRILQHCVRTSFQANADKKLVNHSTLIQKYLSKLSIENNYSTGVQISDNNADVTYVDLKVEHLAEVMQLVKKYYVPIEPICLGLGATYEHVKDIMEHMISETLEHDMSCGIRNNSGELVGLTMAKIQTNKDTTWDDVAKYAEGNKKIELLIKTRKAIANKYELFKDIGVNAVLHSSRSTLHPDYHSIDNIMKLMDLVEQKGVQEGLPYIKAVCTSIQSRKAADRRGYMLVSQTQYKDFDYLDLKAMGENTALSVMIKKLICMPEYLAF